MAKRLRSVALSRFATLKRYALRLACVLEPGKGLLDRLVLMHDQYVTEMCRRGQHDDAQQHRALRQRQKRAIDFAAFLQLPFAAVPGTTGLLDAMALIRQLDAGTLQRLPPRSPQGVCCQNSTAPARMKPGTSTGMPGR
jgi:hypothetical protein